MHRQPNFFNKRPKPLDEKIISVANREDRSEHPIDVKRPLNIELALHYIETNDIDNFKNLINTYREKPSGLFDLVRESHQPSILEKLHKHPLKQAQPFFDALYEIEKLTIEKDDLSAEVFFAICHHQVDQVAKLLPQIDINAQFEEFDSTALNLASEYGFTDIIQMIFDFANKLGIEVDPSESIVLAAQEQHLETLKLLLKKFPKAVNTTVGNNITALSWSIQYGDHEMTELLLKAKADPHINTKKHPQLYWALKLSEYYGRHDMVELLVKHKANASHLTQEVERKTEIESRDLYRYPESIRKLIR